MGQLANVESYILYRKYYFANLNLTLKNFHTCSNLKYCLLCLQSHTGLSDSARAELVSTSDTEAVIHVTDNTTSYQEMDKEDNDEDRKSGLKTEEAAVDKELEEKKRMHNVKDLMLDKHKTTKTQKIPTTDKKNKRVHWDISDQTPSLPSNDSSSQHSDKMVSDVQPCHLGLQSTDPSSSPLSPSSDGVSSSCHQTNLKFSNSLLFDLD